VVFIELLLVGRARPVLDDAYGLPARVQEVIDEQDRPVVLGQGLVPRHDAQVPGPP
jgi:hypothetical protein